MELSEKRRSALYTAISEPIMKKRIAVQQSKNVLGEKNAKDIDDLLYKLERDIFQDTPILDYTNNNQKVNNEQSRREADGSRPETSRANESGAGARIIDPGSKSID